LAGGDLPLIDSTRRLLKRRLWLFCQNAANGQKPEKNPAVWRAMFHTIHPLSIGQIARHAGSVARVGRTPQRVAKVWPRRTPTHPPPGLFS
jgi:hypothetical protein